MLCRLLFALTLASGPAAAEAAPSLDDLAFLVGDWEGAGTFHFPRDPGKAEEFESSRASCRRVLKETYILCESIWTRADGRARSFLQYYNYNRTIGALQVLYIYDNWPQHSSYAWGFDAEAGGFVATTPYEGAKGERGEERILFKASSDGNTINWSEATRFEGEPEGRWLTTFDFVWKRKEVAKPSVATPPSPR